MGTYSFIYSSKVWLTAVFIAPALIVLSEFICNGHVTDAVTIYFAGVVIGLVLSIPSLLALWCSTTMLCRNEKLKPIRIKKLLTISGIILTELPFLWFDDWRFFSGTLLWSAPYAISIIAGIWIYKLETAYENQITYINNLAQYQDDATNFV